MSFKVEKTEEEPTSHAGLVIFGEFIHGLGFRRMLWNHLSRSGSGNGPIS